MTRCARGHSNTIKYDIYGTDGVISFNLNNPKEIYLCIGDEVKTVGLHKVDVPPEYAASQEGSFVDIALGRFREKPADIFEGAKCQKVVDAIDLSGAREEARGSRSVLRGLDLRGFDRGYAALRLQLCSGDSQILRHG